MERQEDEVSSEMSLIGCVGFDILIKRLATGGVLFLRTLLGGIRKSYSKLGSRGEYSAHGWPEGGGATW